MFKIYFYLFCYCSDYCSNVGRIIVKGYDAKLPHDDVESALRKLFSSCGEINDIYICETEDRLYRFVAFFMFSQLNPIRSITTCQRKTFFFFCFRSDATIYFIGEGAAEKALQLSGSDVGGWKAIVTPYPFPEAAGRYVNLRMLTFCFVYY